MSLPDKCSWIKSEDIRPYCFVRKVNWFKEPGSFLKDCNWFDGLDVLKRDPLSMKEEAFARLILKVESQAFQQSGMEMPGWVFYDCALIPGIVAGFAYRTSKLPESIRKVLGEELLTTEWTPLSVFIAIPCGNKKEWVAHNLSSINALIPKEDRMYGLGFLSKSFGLWYANIKQICGMTQWSSPALKLHVNYGDFELLTAYTPVHSYPETLTYRCALSFNSWKRFFDKTEDKAFSSRFDIENNLAIDASEVETMKRLQVAMEEEKGPYHLKPDEVRLRKKGDVLNIYKKV